ncbi:general transcription factor 3C polypeptide 5 [Eurytemora carolleeae]|uniref:general transcription factor 3C polypeptide 5 n=1 Tax=Eurytemora carolleeae TaxID=1294199 RepID=UPI000C758FB6|nr:general transcription factor 3C polypeptide 5 [Eurytemora carolleeae]|eukprot:XP_023324634.1 general transcription factor 3C polypeptide 5-like [Eurytemora affinis]
MATEAEPNEVGESPGLVCIEYPGVVENPEKAVRTLGGLDNIGLVLSEPNRRLELRFRSEDVYCKPTCGERHQCSSFVVKVKRKKLKKGVKDKPEYIHETKLVGLVDSCFRFSNLCDFQYLPMEKDEEGKLSSLYPKVFFQNLVSSDWIEKEAPLFIPPAVFSRMDAPQDYQFRREASAEKSSGTPHNIIGRTRQRRSHHAIFVTYDVEKVPENPRDIAISQMKIKFIDKERFDIVEKNFKERPIWSKNALHAITRIASDRLKFILPALAYYFTTGPWRNQWIKFGYDPRLDSSAGRYQTLDYRVRLQGGARHKVAAKRSYANYLLPYKATNWSKPRTSLINKSAFPGAENERKNEEVETEEDREKMIDVFKFRKGRIPPYRQMFYQYCDIEIESAQELLERNHSETCSERSGWFNPGTEEKLRNLLTEIINTHISEERLKEIESELDERAEDQIENHTGDDSDSDLE